MGPRLTGLDARDEGIAELCAEIAPPGYQVVVAPTAMTTDELGRRLLGTGDRGRGSSPWWVYGSVLPASLFPRSTKVQVHEPFDDDETPSWFDHRFARHVKETTIPGYSCFSPDSLVGAVRHMLGEYEGVRLKDPNGVNGRGQLLVTTAGDVELAIDEIASDAALSHGVALPDYLARFGYVVEANLVDVEAWSVTVTTTPDGEYSSFGRLLELDADTEHDGVVRSYAGTSSVVVRGTPTALELLPARGVPVDDPVAPDRDTRLTPTPEIVGAARRHIEGMRWWEAEGIVKTRANVDVITGGLHRRDGRREQVTGSVEDSGRPGGASPAELMGIMALRSDLDLPYVVRSSRHSVGAAARTYAEHASTIAGSRVFWDGADHVWAGDRVFIGAF